MSRSYKKSPVFWLCSHTAKEDKRIANRALRRRVKQVMDTGEYDSLPQLREVSDPWSWPADGKCPWWNCKPSDLEAYKKSMRK